MLSNTNKQEQLRGLHNTFLWSFHVYHFPFNAISNLSWHFFSLFSLFCSYSHHPLLAAIIQKVRREKHHKHLFPMMKRVAACFLAVVFYYECWQNKLRRNKCLVIFLSHSSHTVYPSTFFGEKKWPSLIKSFEEMMTLRLNLSLSWIVSTREVLKYIGLSNFKSLSSNLTNYFRDLIF